MKVQLNKSLDVLDTDTLETLRSLDNYKGYFLNELVEIFERDAPAVYDRLVRAIQSNAAIEATRQAHKLRGMGGNLGTQRLGSLLERIEVDFEQLDEITRRELPHLVWNEYRAALAALRSQWWTPIAV